MTFNETILNQVIAEAKAKAAGNSRWTNAIAKAVEGLTGAWVVTELADGLMVTTESGETYHANGVCQCKAWKLSQPCKHRAAAQLVKRYNEALTLAAPADERAALIAEMQTTWTAKHPHTALTDALLHRFGKSHLEMLSVDFLQRVQVALAQ